MAPVLGSREVIDIDHRAEITTVTIAIASIWTGTLGMRGSRSCPAGGVATRRIERIGVRAKLKTSRSTNTTPSSAIVLDERAGKDSGLVIQKHDRKGCSGVRPQRADDAYGFEAFFRAVFPKAVAVARKVTGEHAAAEDAAIEALAKAHVRWHRIGPAPWREGWVLRVAVNEAIRRPPRATAGAGGDVASDNAWTGGQRSMEGLGRPLGHGSAGQRAEGSDPAEEIVLRQALTAALRRLPQRQREVVVLRYLIGLSEAQVAEMLDISHGTVKTHLRRAIAGLRKDMDQDLKVEYLASLA